MKDMVTTAYTILDFKMNQYMENTLEKEIIAVFQSNNDYISRIDRVFSFLEYNYSSIRANIRCGMVTKWRTIMQEIILVYDEVLGKSQKDADFMHMCFVYHRCELGILNHVHPIIALHDQYNEARIESVAGILPDDIAVEIAGF
jgi:hypothetical protein